MIEITSEGRPDKVSDGEPLCVKTAYRICKYRVRLEDHVASDAPATARLVVVRPW